MIDWIVDWWYLITVALFAPFFMLGAFSVVAWAAWTDDHWKEWQLDVVASLFVGLVAAAVWPASVIIAPMLGVMYALKWMKKKSKK